MLVSPEWSSTSPTTIFIGHEPSARCVSRAQAKARSAASRWSPTTSAIAASRWFHTSVCSPGVHGIAPDGSCTAAMVAAVCSTWARVRIASTDGGSAHAASGLRK